MDSAVTTMDLTMHAVPEPTREDVAKVYWDALSKDERAARLNAALTHKGMSQSNLMRRLGVSWPTVNNWSTGKTPISWARWLQICHAIQLEVDWRPPPPPPPPEPSSEEPSPFAREKPPS